MKSDIILTRINYLNEHLLLKQIAIIITYVVLAKIVDLFIVKILSRRKYPAPFPQLDVHFDQQIEAEERAKGLQSSLERN
jgi:hypothetical protein